MFFCSCNWFEHYVNWQKLIVFILSVALNKSHQLFILTIAYQKGDCFLWACIFSKKGITLQMLIISLWTKKIALIKRNTFFKQYIKRKYKIRDTLMITKVIKTSNKKDTISLMISLTFTSSKRIISLLR